MSHSFQVQVGAGQVCTDGAIFEGQTTAASSLNLALTAQVWDAGGTTVLATGDSHTFTAVGESFVFTVMGSFTAGSTVLLAVSNTPGTPPAFGTEGDATTATVGDCTLAAVPSLPVWAALLLALALLAGGALAARRGRPAPIAAGGLAAATLLGLAAAPAAASVSYPQFSKSFAPSTIGPGSISKLTLTIDNSGGLTTVENLAFTDTLPAGMALADPASADTDCDNATLVAPDGGTTITFTDGRLGKGVLCTVSVNVIATATGMNTTGTLTSDAGSHGTASATLTVDTGRPGFSKSFAPGSIPSGGISTLTFLIDNSSNAGAETFLAFTDNLPAGVVVAAVPNASTTCGASLSPSLTATPGSSSISLSVFGTMVFPAVPALSTCTVSVDVTATANGSFDNVSGELELSEDRSSGFATDTLEAPRQSLNKVFLGGPVQPGLPVTLEFTLQNPSRTSEATDIGFTDDLDSVLSGLAPSGPLPTDPCGAGSSLTFAGGVLTLEDGSLAPEGSCTFGVTLLVPAGAAPGAYGNTTTALTATIDGDAFTGNTASDVLFVTTAPILIKEFTDDPVGAGGSVTLEFTIINTSPTSMATDIAFTDDIGGFPPGRMGAIPGLAANGLVAPSGLDPAPLVDPCGSGSELTIPDPNDSLPSPPFPNLPPDPTLLIFTGGTLEPAGSPGDSCTFSITLDVPAGTPLGTYTNTTSAVTATVDDGTKTGNPAAGDLDVVGAPTLTKEFTDDPTAPGGTVTLEFTLTLDDEAPAGATAIAFTDDLTALVPAVPGLEATAVTLNTCAGSTVDITTTPTKISVSGASLTPGESCAIEVTLSVPAGTSPGQKTNTTSDVTATVGGVAVTGDPAQDTLRVSGLILTKTFLDTPPAIPGGTVVLRFTLTNNEASAATGISFSDDLDANLPSLAAAAPLPTMPCGGSLSGTSTLSFSGGSVAAMSSCSFDVTLDVPATVPPGVPSDGVYGNTTSAVSYSGGTADPAFDELTVDSELLALTKSFTDDPTVPGGTVTLEITIENLDPARAASAIALSDDLDAALAGLTIGSVLLDDCGGTLSGVGTTLLSYSGGSLAAGATCTIRLSLDVPAGPLPGNTFTNTTSAASGTIAGLPVFGAAATDDLRVFTVTLAKAFSKANVAAGESLDLTFTLTNLDSSAGVSELAFSDSLPAGLTATALPPTPCSAGSTISGTTFLTFSGGSLGPSGSCVFAVTVQVPAPATVGSFVNTTSQLFQSGLPVAGAATAPLEVEPPPTFAKAFAPNPIAEGGVSTLTFTIDNTASAVAATGLTFSDTLPAGLVVASVPNGSTTCTGGTLTAMAGSGTIGYSGGAVAAGASCVVQADVTSSVPGSYDNVSGALTSSSGNSGTASDTLTVNPAPPLFSKSFAPDPIAEGGVSTLTFTIDNSGRGSAATGLTFTDPLPAGLVVASVPNAATTCSGGTLTAVAGSGTIGYSGGAVAAGASCVVQADVTSSVPGSYDNTSGELTSSSGNSGTASDTLTVNPAPPLFSKSFAPDPVIAGFDSTLTFTIDNTASALAATGLAFFDMLPFGLQVAATPMLVNQCGGSVVAPAGSATISLTGGAVAASASCTLSIAVTATFAGDFANVTGELTSSSGNSGTASDTLTAVPCAAPDGLDLTLGSDLVLATETYTVCRKITIEQHYTVLGPSGRLVLRAGVAVSISNGVEFGADSELSITIDPSLATP